jgi:PiT family inorganic phosphate transporter
VVTLPAAAAVGAVAYALANAIGGTAGSVGGVRARLVFVGGIYRLSRQAPVDQHNVNAEWTGSVAPQRDLVDA